MIQRRIAFVSNIAQMPTVELPWLWFVLRHRSVQGTADFLDVVVLVSRTSWRSRTHYFRRCLSSSEVEGIIN